MAYRWRQFGPRRGDPSKVLNTIKSREKRLIFSVCGKSVGFCATVQTKVAISRGFFTLFESYGIERFEGVCILATKRRRKLEKTLSRGISMQVKFPRPQTAAERLRI